MINFDDITQEQNREKLEKSFWIQVQLQSLKLQIS